MSKKVSKSGKTNPVKKYMDRLHKPATHSDRTKYNRKALRKINYDDTRRTD